MDVSFAVDTLRKYFPFWESLEDHCLDAETIKDLAEVLNLQRSQLRYQSSSLYTNPELLEKKFRTLSVKRLGEIFLKSWHPIVEREQLTVDAIQEGIQYWKQMLSYEARRKRLAMGKAAPPVDADLDYLVRSGILTREDFEKHLQGLWKELMDRTGEGSSVDYWSFVRRNTYQQTVERAYFVSFLLTYGFARLVREVDSMRLVPLSTPAGKAVDGLISYPIPIPKQVVRSNGSALDESVGEMTHGTS